MKFILPAFVTLHGVIHLMGFAKAFNLIPLDRISLPISKVMGVFWLIAFLLFMITAYLLFKANDRWWLIAAVAVLISQILVFSAWDAAKFASIPNALILLMAFVGFCTWNFRNNYEQAVANSQAQQVGLSNDLLTLADLQPLPVPVRKYLLYSGAVGKPKVTSFKVAMVGWLQDRNSTSRMPFTSEQYNSIGASTRLFFLDASMKHLPVAGLHSFVNGVATMDIRLFSIYKVQYQSGKEADIAETVTFFNDMCCLAPATLIDKRIKWLSVNGDEVEVEFSHNGISIKAVLYFNDIGELTNFTSNDRYAIVENVLKNTPWSTPISDYRELNGHRLPRSAKTIYSYPEGDFCYGSFNILSVTYN